MRQTPELKSILGPMSSSQKLFKLLTLLKIKHVYQPDDHLRKLRLFAERHYRVRPA